MELTAPPLTRRRTRRWPVTAAVLTGVLLAGVGVAGGAARATADAASTATQLAAQGDYGGAIAIDNALAQRSGPLYLLDRSDVQQAPYNAQRTLLAWADALDRAGKVDQAVAVTGRVHDPRLAAAAGQERTALLIRAARAAAAKGDYSLALVRLGQVEGIGLTASTSTQVAQLQAMYQVGAARGLTAAGRGVEAVALLDTAANHGAGSPAGAVLPAALLAAGREEIRQQSYKEAAAMLQRLVSSFGSSAEAGQARALLDAGQPVSGVLVDKSGKPLSGQVRLSSHYFNEPGGYLTTGPFYNATAGSDGVFRFDSIPQGGPYVFEFFHSGDWTTFIDPSTNQPADPVNVTPLTPVDLSFIPVP